MQREKNSRVVDRIRHVCAVVTGKKSGELTFARNCIVTHFPANTDSHLHFVAFITSLCRPFERFNRNRRNS